MPPAHHGHAGTAARSSLSTSRSTSPRLARTRRGAVRAHSTQDTRRAPIVVVGMCCVVCLEEEGGGGSCHSQLVWETRLSVLWAEALLRTVGSRHGGERGCERGGVRLSCTLSSQTVGAGRGRSSVKLVKRVTCELTDTRVQGEESVLSTPRESNDT